MSGKTLHYGHPVPSLKDIENVEVKFERSRLIRRIQPTPYTIIYDQAVSFKSVRSYGSLFSQKYKIVIEVLLDQDEREFFVRTNIVPTEIDVDGLNNSNTSITIKHLLERVKCAEVAAFRTGIFFPSVLYMDSLPALIHFQGMSDPSYKYE